MKNNRVIIYIDSSNLYKGNQLAYGNGKVNHKEFCKFLANGRPLMKIKYFCVDPPEPYKGNYDFTTSLGRSKYINDYKSYLSQISFLKHLSQWKKIELIKGRLQKSNRTGLYQEKGVDVALAIHMIADAISKNHDISIVVTGDADLVMPIEILQNSFDINVEGAAFSPCYHIKQACGTDNFTFLNGGLLKQFLKK